MSSPVGQGGLIAAALKWRERILPPETSIFRAFDSAPDGCEGVKIDVFADRMLVTTKSKRIPARILSELSDQPFIVYHKILSQTDKEAPRLLYGPANTPEAFTALEQGVKFEISMGAGYSQGIFPDQRIHRAQMRDFLRPGMTLLNTFAYTGGFSVYGALAGAATTTLDLAQPCLDWAKRNMALNGIDPATQFFCKGDTIHWLERFVKQGRLFDAIVLDPPTFSRDKSGRVFRAERDYGSLVELALGCLALGGRMLCTSNCEKLTHRDFFALVHAAAPGCKLSNGTLPPEFRGSDHLKRLWITRR